MGQLPATVHLTIYHGDTWTQAFRLRQGDTPVDLTGATVASWARPWSGPAIPLAAAIGDPPTSGVITLSTPAPGLPPGGYHYDLEVTDPVDQVTTWIRGQITVMDDITNTDTPLRLVRSA